MYSIVNVKKICEVIYGKPILHRTWIRWKKASAIPARAKMIDEEAMGRIVTLTNMRLAHPKTKYKLTEILEEKKRVLAEFNKSRLSYQNFLIPDNCSGKEIPEIIELTTGRKLSRAALYRLGNRAKLQYSTTASYERNDVLKLISAV